MLLKAEASERDVRSISYPMKAVKFPPCRDLTDFGQSAVYESPVKSLHQCQFLEDAQNAELVVPSYFKGVLLVTQDYALAPIS